MVYKKDIKMKLTRQKLRQLILETYWGTAHGSHLQWQLDACVRELLDLRSLAALLPGMGGDTEPIATKAADLILDDAIRWRGGELYEAFGDRLRDKLIFTIEGEMINKIGASQRAGVRAHERTLRRLK